MSSQDDRTRPMPPSGRPDVPPPEDVDALLAESLRAQSEEDFTWKEPERKPRWWQRQEMHQASAGSTTVRSSAGERKGVRLGSVIFGAVCLLLALWVLATVTLGLMIDPIVVGLVVCTAAGLSLVLAGLRPKPGTRL
ncbi:hypothetical protein [Nesterenkonia populi]|uniref:hypothetical protein n=1 Tax=Nesterenkonia populi TaxID=1591087 RepID=UPI0011BE6615|nr:hypothetical protein [Nesterenkonia populi]